MLLYIYIYLIFIYMQFTIMSPAAFAIILRIALEMTLLMFLVKFTLFLHLTKLKQDLIHTLETQLD